VTFIVKPSRAGSVVAEAYRLKEVDERRMSRIHKVYRTKPIAEPQEPAPSKTAKPPAKSAAKRKAKR
jgi:hypothetical protein